MKVVTAYVRKSDYDLALEMTERVLLKNNFRYLGPKDESYIRANDYFIHYFLKLPTEPMYHNDYVHISCMANDEYDARFL